MPKYNITDKKQKTPLYRTTLSESLAEELYQKIMVKFIVEKKYRYPKYSAQEMAKELGTNTRYVSAVINLKYQDNCSQMVNDFRVKEAMYMLSDIHYVNMTMEDVGTKVGFANRQCFYAAFFRRVGMSPFEYKKQNMLSLKNNMMKKKGKKDKSKGKRKDD